MTYEKNSNCNYYYIFLLSIYISLQIGWAYFSYKKVIQTEAIIILHVFHDVGCVCILTLTRIVEEETYK